jgi:hypothetical protein
VVAKALQDMVSDDGSEKSQRIFEAIMSIKKLDIAALRRAYKGLED